MTDPRIEVAARAICDRHNGVWLDGDYDHDNDVWRCDAAAALAAADAVDEVREAGPWIRDADVLGLIQFTRIDEVGERDTVEPEFGIWRAFIEGMGVTVIESEP